MTDTEDIVLLEVNSLPGMTPTSLFPDGARAKGLAFDALMEALVAAGSIAATRLTASEVVPRSLCSTR